MVRAHGRAPVDRLDVGVNLQSANAAFIHTGLALANRRKFWRSATMARSGRSARST
ncbi:hypothetical protein [Paraburkholderia sp. BCC1886]|uniref:hypothetical protein n=1 Tax=Paraburkholderia sp. BCC1886 TaxID=2562670 RepID=UPI001642BA99|nr:hypothetical protein [Paraburkholderia sp. BCC1886]